MRRPVRVALLDARRLGLPPSAVNGRIECMLARLGPAKRAA
jgi:hypothetical protein